MTIFFLGKPTILLKIYLAYIVRHMMKQMYHGKTSRPGQYVWLALLPQLEPVQKEDYGLLNVWVYLRIDMSDLKFWL